MQENAQQNTSIEELTFDDLGLKKEILRSIKDAGFVVPSPIQAQAIPFVLAGRDMVGQAHTGTGKTAAFGLPAINNMHLKGGIEVLVITPTRELATQVSDELFK
jgi:ATP-dependent RNA helicase DeaD